MSFNPNITEITSMALTKLKGKTFGGVSKESAAEAVERGVTEAIRQGQNAIGQVQQEMSLLRNKTAHEIAQITSEKDVAIFRAKQEAQQEIATAQKAADEKVKQAKAPKVFEKILPNGIKTVRKVNRNGAVMEKESIIVRNKDNQPEERLLSVKVQNLAGDVRKSSYSPHWEKPQSTYTDTNGPKVYVYDQYGNTRYIKDVNVKKIMSPKPTIVEQTPAKPIPGYWQGETGMEIERIYSDGSKDTITKIMDRNHSDNTRVKLVKVDKDGKFIEETTKWGNGSVRSEKRLPNGTTRQTESYIAQDGSRSTSYYDTTYDKTMNQRVTTGFGYSNSKLSYSAKLQKDEFGLYTDKYRTKIKFPKESGKKPMFITGSREYIAGYVNELQKELQK